MKYAVAALMALLSLFVLAPAAQAAENTESVRYGPFTIPAGTHADPGMVNNEARFGVQRPCSDCHITSFKPDLVFEDGTRATLDDEVMLHHVVLHSQFQPDATCGNNFVGLLGQRFFASGNERTEMTFPDGYGYRVQWYDSWNLIVDLMNHSASEKKVYLEVTYTYRPSSESVKRVRPVWLDIDLCGDGEYSIPAGFSDTHRDWNVNVPGKVVAAGGHMHGHGVAVEATNERRGGRSICRSEAELHPTDVHRVLSMSTCTGDPLAVVRRGETVRLHSEYQSPRATDDVMGIMLMYIHPR